MRYHDLGLSFAPHQHALQWSGQDLDDAISRNLLGVTTKTSPNHPDPTYYMTGDFWRWMEANLGEIYDGRWKFASNAHMRVVELRLESKQVAMQLKLLFAGTPVLIP